MQEAKTPEVWCNRNHHQCDDCHLLVYMYTTVQVILNIQIKWTRCMDTNTIDRMHKYKYKYVKKNPRHRRNWLMGQFNWYTVIRWRQKQLMQSIEFWTKKQDWLEVKFLHWLGMNLVSHNSLLQGLRLPNRHMLQTTQLVVKSVRELTLAARMQMSEWIIWLPSHCEQFGPSFQFHRSVNRVGRGERVTTLAPKNSHFSF